MPSALERLKSNPARVWIMGAAGVLIVLLARWVLARYNAPFVGMHQEAMQAFWAQNVAAIHDSSIMPPQKMELGYKSWLLRHHASAATVELMIALAGVGGIILLNLAITRSVMKESKGTRWVTGCVGMIYILSALQA
ncbi:MAG: hypothetical protein QM755_24325 [Luteolibacter sp.]